MSGVGTDIRTTLLHLLVSCVPEPFGLLIQEATLFSLVSSLNWTNSLTGDERQQQQRQTDKLSCSIFYPGYRVCEKLLPEFIHKKSESPLFWREGGEVGLARFSCLVYVLKLYFLRRAWPVFIVHLRKAFIFHWCADSKAL